MNEIDLKNAWQSYDKKLDQLLEVNFHQLKLLKSEKAESNIHSFKRSHVFVMILGVIWVSFLGFLLYHTRDNIYFSLSVSGILLFNIFAVFLYLKHLVILASIDIGASITETQQKLSRVYTSYTQVGRVLLLQAPLYCTWWYSPELVANASTAFWVINLSIVALFTVLSVYLFSKLSLKSSSQNWVQRTDNLFGAGRLQKAISFLNEIEEFKRET